MCVCLYDDDALQRPWISSSHMKPNGKLCTVHSVRYIREDFKCSWYCAFSVSSIVSVTRLEYEMPENDAQTTKICRDRKTPQA